MNQSDIDILAKEEAEAMELARKEDAGELAATPEAAPSVVVAPTPPPAPSPDLTSIMNEVTELKARNAELTQRLNSEDGRRGGELRSLRETVEALKAQNQALVESNRKLTEAKADPPPPPVDDEEDKAFSEHFPKRAQREKAEAAKREAELERVRKEAKEAKDKAEALERQSMDAATARFTVAVQARVPSFLNLVKDPVFCTWADSTYIRGTGMTYGQSYDNAAGQLDANTAAEVFEAFVESQKASAPPAPAAVEPVKPPKPSKESQAVPGSAGGSNATPASDASKTKAAKAARLAELEYKLGMTGHTRTATIAESQEWDKLIQEIAADS